MSITPNRSCLTPLRHTQPGAVPDPKRRSYLSACLTEDEGEASDTLPSHSALSITILPSALPARRRSETRRRGAR